MSSGITTGTIVRALLTVMIILLVLATIVTLIASLKEEGTPFIEDLKQAIQVGKQAAQAPDAQGESQLVNSFNNLVVSFEECQKYSNSDCGCNLKLLASPLPEDYYIAVANTDKGLAMAAFTNEQVPIAEKSYAGTKLGVLHYDDNKNELLCVFPKTYYIKKSDATTTNSYDIVTPSKNNIAILLDNKLYDILTEFKIEGYNDFRDLNKYFSLSEQFYEISPLLIQNSYKIVIYGEVPVTGSLNADTEKTSYIITFKDNHWRISNTPMSHAYKKINFFTIGAPDTVKDIFNYLNDNKLTPEQGKEYFEELKLKRESLKNNLNSDSFAVPNLIKIDSKTYCISSELIAQKKDIGSLAIANSNLILGPKSEYVYYFNTYPMFYLINKNYCSKLGP